MKRILNVGCGNDTYGTDFVDLYPKRREVIKCKIDREALPFKDNTFDEVRFYFVFEHMRNHHHVLKEIFRVLKTGGILDLKTDNASYWWFSLDNKTHTGKYEEIAAYGTTDRHFTLFTDSHIRNHLKDCGFKKMVIKMSYDNAKSSRNNKLNYKGKIVLLINFILSHIKPIRRMGFSEIQAIATK